MSSCSSLTTNTTGQSNTAVGYQALFNNTTGQHNTANSSQALNSNTTGIRTLPWFSDGIGPIDEFTYSSPADTGSNFRIDRLFEIAFVLMGLYHIPSRIENANQGGTDNCRSPAVP